MDTREKAKQAQEQAEAALKDVFGDRVRADGGAIDGNFVTLKFRVALAEGSEAQATLREQFNSHARWLGLEPSDFDLPLTLNGQRAELVEIHAGRSKYPFVVKRADGKRFKVTADAFLLARVRKSA